MEKILPNKKKEKNEGQAVLIVLLSVVVILTIGLSIVSRSITDIKISQQTQESARVFWVAQAGLEQAVKANIGVGSGSNPSQLNNINYYVSKTEFGNANTLAFDDSTVGRVGGDEEKIVWLVGHDSNGNLTETGYYDGGSLVVQWGENDLKPALVATLIYKDGSEYKFKRFPFDTATRTPATGFTGISCDSSGSYVCSTTTSFGLSSGNIPYLISFKLYFLDQDKRVPLRLQGDPGKNLPSQGSCFESIATQGVSNISRKLKECKTWPQPQPQFLNYVLFSASGGIEK